MKPPANIKTILLIAFLIETLCVTYALFFPVAIGFTSVTYTVSGLVIAWALLWLNRKGELPVIHPFSFNSTLNRYRWVLMGARFSNRACQ